MVGFRLDPSVRAVLEQIANERGQSLSEVLRLAAEEYADRWRHGG